MSQDADDSAPSEVPREATFAITVQDLAKYRNDVGEPSFSLLLSLCVMRDRLATCMTEIEAIAEEEGEHFEDERDLMTYVWMVQLWLHECGRNVREMKRRGFCEDGLSARARAAWRRLARLASAADKAGPATWLRNRASGHVDHTVLSVGLDELERTFEGAHTVLMGDANFPEEVYSPLAHAALLDGLLVPSGSVAGREVLRIGLHEIVVRTVEDGRQTLVDVGELLLGTLGVVD